MKYLIILIALISTVYTSCPSMCNCTDSSVLCIGKDLEYIPNFESLLNNPIIIDLSGNKIKSIGLDDFSFEKSNMVKEVYLNNSEITDIDSEAFEEMENLQELYMGQNLLNEVSEFLIEQHDNMVLLDLSNNYFSGDMPKIRSKSLEVLALANSKITSIPSDSLKYLPNLKLLLIQQNNIKSITPSVFENIRNNFFFVRLSYNAWDCNCETIALFDFLANKNFIDTSEPYQCLNKNRNFVNVYDKNGVITNLKCKRNVMIAKQLDTDFADYKEARAFIDRDKTLSSMDLDKPYSLVKSSEEPTKIDLKEMADEVNSSDEDTAKLDIEEEVVPSNDCEILSTDIAFDVNMKVFVVLIVGFVLGFVLGFSINQLILVRRYRKMQVSDSTTKLIVA